MRKGFPGPRTAFVLASSAGESRSPAAPQKFTSEPLAFRGKETRILCRDGREGERRPHEPGFTRVDVDAREAGAQTADVDRRAHGGSADGPRPVPGFTGRRSFSAVAAPSQDGGDIHRAPSGRRPGPGGKVERLLLRSGGEFPRAERPSRPAHFRLPRRASRGRAASVSRWRRERDSNPRGVAPNTLSRRAP